MSIFAFGLVFDKVQRLSDFADVVIISADLRQHRVGTDFCCGGFHQRTDNDRVMIGAGCFNHQTTHDRSIQMRQFKQCNVGGKSKGNFNQRYNSGRYDTGADAPQKGKGPIPYQFGSRQLTGIKMDGGGQHNI